VEGEAKKKEAKYQIMIHFISFAESNDGKKNGFVE